MKKFNRLGLLSLSVLTLGLLVVGAKASENKALVTFAYSRTTPSAYYKNIDGSLKNNALLKQLQDLNATKLVRRVGYDNMASKYQETDPGERSGEVTSFYSGNSARFSGNMNKEHVWPASRTVLGRDNDPLEDDIHMVRPTLKAENSSRGNSFFVEGMEDDKLGWDPAMPSFGDETYRGDSARIIFYCVVADPQLKLVDVNYEETYYHSMGKLSDLLKWNLKYPVTDRENIRNDAAEKLQGNRNPFIDHPEYACRIWGFYDKDTQIACGYDKISDFHLSYTTKTMSVGKTFRINYFIEPDVLLDMVEITWSSSDPSVVHTTSTGLITTKSVGNAVITANIEKYGVTASCSFKVINSSSSNGCGGNIYTSSVVVSVISAVGISLLLIRRGKKYER